MIFTDYWKLLVLIFSGIRNTVFFWAKELRERWCLLISEKLLFWTFRWWEIRSFLSKEVDGKIVFTGYWEVLVLNFSLMGNTAFFQPKIWCKDDINLVFLSLPWSSRTWEMWVFVQWHLDAFHAVDGNYNQECPLPSSAVLGVISIHEEN